MHKTITQPHNPKPSIAEAIRADALQLGFAACRFMPVSPPRRGGAFADWLAAGMAGDMDYLQRGAAVRLNPRLGFNLHQNQDSAAVNQSAQQPPINQPAQTLVVLATRYPIHTNIQSNPNDHQATPTPPPTLTERQIQQYYQTHNRRDAPLGRIARYAWGGRDYHRIIRPRLVELDRRIRARTGRLTHAKGWVDTGPVLERDFAEQTGIGFTGKNTCTIHSEWGSWIFLSTLWLPERLDWDPPSQFNPTRQQLTWPTDTTLTPSAIHVPHNEKSPSFLNQSNTNPPTLTQRTKVGGCGGCSRCLTACPTGALSPQSPWVLDARLCISYWTIESHQPAPTYLRRQFGNWIFGCDDCQSTCPWNEKAEEIAQNQPNPTKQPQSPDEIIDPTPYQWPNGPWLPLMEGFSRQTPYWLNDAAFQKQFQATPIMRAGRQKMLHNVFTLLFHRATNRL